MADKKDIKTVYLNDYDVEVHEVSYAGNGILRAEIVLNPKPTITLEELNKHFLTVRGKCEIIDSLLAKQETITFTDLSRMLVLPLPKDIELPICYLTKEESDE